MGKKLFQLVIIVLVLGAAGRWLLQWDLQRQLDQALRDADAVIYARYDKFELGFDGEVVVKRITLTSAQDDNKKATIDSVSVDFDSLPELLQQRFSGRLPNQMKVKLSGLIADLGELSAMSEQSVNCMDPELQPAAWMLGILDESDVEFGYSYDSVSRDLNVDVGMRVRGGYELTTNVQLGDVTPRFNAAGSIDLIKVTFDDIRWVDTWLDYCAEHHKLAPADFIEAHIKGVDAYLREQGLSLTAPVQDAYRSYLTDSGRIVAKWILNLSVPKLKTSGMPKDVFIDKLQLELAGESISPIFERVTPVVRVSPAQAQAKAKQAQLAKANKPVGPVEISFEEARQHIGREVQIVTGSKITEGELTQVGEFELVLDVAQSGKDRFAITYYRSRLDKIILLERE